MLPFSKLTNLFMRVRYGMYEVGSSDYAEAEALAEQVAELTPAEEAESSAADPTQDIAVESQNASPAEEKGGER